MIKKNFAKYQEFCDHLTNLARKALFEGNKAKCDKLIQKRDSIKEKILNWKVSDVM